MSHSMKPRRVVREIHQSVCVILLLLTCGALAAQNPKRGVRNIVLVHGAWADGSGWKGVYTILVKDASALLRIDPGLLSKSNPPAL